MRKRIRVYLVRGVLAIVLITLGFVGWQGVKLWLAWRSFEHIEFDPAASRSRLPALPPTTTTTMPGGGDAPELPPPPPPLPFLEDPSAVDVFLLVGSDEDKPDVASLRADSILLFVWPKDGSGPLLTSLPRDLYVRSPCTGQGVRINATLAGCGDTVNGPELLALTVEDFTGLLVDHFAIVSFEGFVDIIDKLGGVDVCVNTATRAGPLELPPGCTALEGTDALVWLRERALFQLVDGEWQAAPSGDLARADRQQQLMIQLLSRLRRFRSPLELSGLVTDLSDAFVLDQGLRLGKAVDLAWDLRRVNPGAVQRRTLAVQDHVTDDGEFVRLPLETFESLLYAAYGVDAG